MDSLRYLIPNKPLKYFLSKQSNQTFFFLVFNRTHKTFPERFFENCPIIKHYELINITLNPMGEVNF